MLVAGIYGVGIPKNADTLQHRIEHIGVRMAHTIPGEALGKNAGEMRLVVVETRGDELRYKKGFQILLRVYLLRFDQLEQFAVREDAKLRYLMVGLKQTNDIKETPKLLVVVVTGIPIRSIRVKGSIPFFPDPDGEWFDPR